MKFCCNSLLYANRRLKTHGMRSNSRLRHRRNVRSVLNYPRFRFELGLQSEYHSLKLGHPIALRIK
jgi:hypothetical protein